MSLTESIFGSNQLQKGTKKDVEAEVDKDVSPSLSNIFDSSKTLPQPSLKLNFSETNAQRTKREKREEKRKKRKGRDKSKQEETDAVANNVKDSNYSTTTREGDGSKKKQRKSKKDEKNIENKEDCTVESGENTTDKKMQGKNERTIFVGNLPKDTTRQSLASLFKSCGKVESSRIRSLATAGIKVAPEHAGNQNLVKKISANTNQLLENTAKKTLQGYVVFKEKDSVQGALKMNNTMLEGLRIRVDTVNPSMDSTRSVFVGNLPYAASEMSLREHFLEGCGWDDDNSVEGVRIIRDSTTMQCKGFGYVLLRDKSLVPDALKMHESSYMKRDIRVTVCGKRFKGRKGAPKESKEDIKELSGAARRMSKKKTTNNDILYAPKEKKKRGNKKIGVVKAANKGISKRAASNKKVEKRVKQIKKRMTKGMGKMKN